MTYSSVKKISLILLKIFMSLGAIGVIYVKTEFKTIFEKLKYIDLKLLILGYLLQNISVILSAVRSRIYFREYGLNIELKDSITLYYLGMFYNLALPGGIGGDGYKVYVLWKKERFPKLRALRVFFYERFNGVSALALIASVLLLCSSIIGIYFEERWLFWLLAIILFPTYLIFAHFMFRDKLKVALKSFPYSFAAQFTHLLSALTLVYALNISTNFMEISNYLLVIISSSIFAILPITIGGIGIRELTFLYAAETLSIVNLNTGISFAICNYALYLSAGLTGGLFFYKLRGWKSSHGITQNTGLGCGLESRKV